MLNNRNETIERCYFIEKEQPIVQSNQPELKIEERIIRFHQQK